MRESVTCKAFISHGLTNEAEIFTRPAKLELFTWLPPLLRLSYWFNHQQVLS